MKGSPLTTAPAVNSTGTEFPLSFAASISSINAEGNSERKRSANSVAFSTSTMSSSRTPRCNSALVNTPVPGPSSMTDPVAVEISRVITSERLLLEGTTDATHSGFATHARKKRKLSNVEVLFNGLFYSTDQEVHEFLDGQVEKVFYNL
jgi:hypothetical protein